MAKVKYFDLEKNLWGEKRPAKDSWHNLQPGMKWVVSNTDFKELEHGTDRLYDSFCDLLNNSQPTVALLHGASQVLSRIKTHKTVRKNYALVEPRGNVDEAPVGFVLNTVPVEVVYETKDSKSLKTLVHLSLGNSKGSSLSLVVATADAGQRTLELPFSLKGNEKANEADMTLFACSMTSQGGALAPHRDSAVREMCKGAHFVDALERLSDHSSNSSWSLWLRSTKYDVHADRLGRRGDPRHTVLTLSPRSAIDVAPMTRSVKSTTKGGNAVLPDPAVLSAEVASQGKSQGNEILMLLKKNRWKLEQSFQLGPDAKLSPQEAPFDLSRYFNSVEEAVKQLNNTKDWPADYCVVHQTVLYSDAMGPSPDRTSFRRYAKENHKLFPQTGFNGSSSANMVAAYSQRPTPSGSEYALFNRARQGQLSETPRSWCVSSSIIIYQTTPREMKFNITHLVPFSKDALRDTIRYLNRDPRIAQEKNPLYDYQHDYALLQSVEHQGFWLIAAKHVACDIVACRMVV